MSRRVGPARPWGVGLWGSCGVVRPGQDLSEVKIIGVSKKGKIYVWKQLPGGEPYVAQINPENLKNAEHAPYLIDPPEGTEDEQPALGEIPDPANFSGDLTQIKALKKPHPDAPDHEHTKLKGWIPSKKLEMIAQMMKEKGLKPQDTFQKALAAGMEIPKEMPAPAGLHGLAKAQGKDPKQLELPNLDTPPKADEPQPELGKATPDDVAAAVKDADTDWLDKHWDDAGLSIKTSVLNAFNDIPLNNEDVPTLEKELKLTQLLAKKSAGKSTEKGYNQHASDLQDKISKLKNPPKEPPSDEDFDQAIATKDAEWIKQNAESFDSAHWATLYDSFSLDDIDHDSVQAVENGLKIAQLLQGHYDKPGNHTGWVSANAAASLAATLEKLQSGKGPGNYQVDPQVTKAVAAGDFEWLHNHAADLGPDEIKYLMGTFDGLEGYHAAGPEGDASAEELKKLLGIASTIAFNASAGTVDWNSSDEDVEKWDEYAKALSKKLKEKEKSAGPDKFKAYAAAVDNAISSKDWSWLQVNAAHVSPEAYEDLSKAYGYLNGGEVAHGTKEASTAQIVKLMDMAGTLQAVAAVSSDPSISGDKRGWAQHLELLQDKLDKVEKNKFLNKVAKALVDENYAWLVKNAPGFSSEVVSTVSKEFDTTKADTVESAEKKIKLAGVLKAASDSPEVWSSFENLLQVQLEDLKKKADKETEPEIPKAILNASGVVGDNWHQLTKDDVDWSFLGEQDFSTLTPEAKKKLHEGISEGAWSDLIDKASYDDSFNASIHAGCKMFKQLAPEYEEAWNALQVLYPIPGEKPVELTSVEPEPAPAAVYNLIEGEKYEIPWKGKPPAGYKILSNEESAAHQEKYGLAPNEFIHPVSGEVFEVTDLDTENEYLDPNGYSIKFAGDKPSLNKTIKPTGSQLINPPFGVDAPAMVMPVLQEEPKPSAVLEVSEPPHVHAVTPSGIEELPQAVLSAPDQETAQLKAAQQVKLPANVPDPTTLKLVGSGSFLGGAGEKVVYQDKNGQKWLFKRAQAKAGGVDKPYAAVAQQVWSQVAKVIHGDEHLPVGVTTIDGKLGTLQPLLDLDPDQPSLAGVAPEHMSHEVRHAVAREHLKDWLCSQHDSHGANFIRTKDGRVLSVDKEQGFRFFGSDSLSVDYQPNTDLHGEKPPIYNALWRGFAEGKYDMDPSVLVPDLEAIEALSTADYIQMLKPYAETMFPKKPDAQTAWLKQARRRKLNLRKDFEGFITLLMRKRTKEDGNFTFHGGWSGTKPHADGPKVKKVKYDAAAYIAKVSEEHGVKMKTEPYYSDFAAKKVDSSKICFKVVSQAGSVEKARAIFAALGVKPEGESAAGYYRVWTLDKSKWDKASVTMEEIDQPKTAKGAAPPTPAKPRYFPDDHDFAVAAPNSKELKQVVSTSFGRHSKRFESDGPLVEGSAMRLMRKKDGQGTYYEVNLKLRPHVWSKIQEEGNGKASSYSFGTGWFDEGSDSYKDLGQHIDDVPTKRWEHEDSEIHMVGGTKEYDGHWHCSKYAYMGSVFARVRPKPGQEPHEALGQLLDKMRPGLSKDLLRDATPEEREIYKMSQALWAYAPQEADKLEAEDQRDPAKLKAALTKAKIKVDRIKKMELREVLPGHSTWVDPERAKSLREKGARFVFHSVSGNDIVSILNTGAVGIQERNNRGVKASNAISYSADVTSGSAEGVLGYVATQGMLDHYSGWGTVSFHKQAHVIVGTDELARLDTYLHKGDKYGSTTPYTSQVAGSVWTQRETVEKHVGKLNNHPEHHEISFKRGLGAKSIIRVTVADEAHRQDMIKQCKAAGILEHNGVPIDDFIVLEGHPREVYEKYVKPLEVSV